EPVELQDRSRVDPVLSHVGEIGERLNNMKQTIQSERAALYVLPSARDFEGSFRSGIEDSSERITSKWNGMGELWFGKNKIRHEWVCVLGENRVPEVTRLAVVGATKADARHNREPPEVGVG